MVGRAAKMVKTKVDDDISAGKLLIDETQDLVKRRAELSAKMAARAKELMAPMLEEASQREDDGEKTPKDKEAFQATMDLIKAALDLDDENDEAKEGLQAMMEAFEPDEPKRPPPNHDHKYDVIVVGAGASGVGVGLMLQHLFNLDPERVLLVERGEKVGESFRRWPREMRFISPSFNNQGWTTSFDLNSVAYQTAPSYTLHTEHPTGAEYAHYLEELAGQGELNIQFSTQVTAVTPIRTGGFKVDVAPVKAEGATGWSVDEASATTLRSRYVIWAAGEFQYPRDDAPLFPGSELCQHNSSVRSWKELPGDDFVVIGGYESGMDAVYNLTQCGKRCTVASSTAFWKVTTDDPSTELAPYTMERVRQAFRTAKVPPRLLSPLRVEEVVKEDNGDGYLLRARWGAPVKHEGGEHRTPFHSGDADIEERGVEGKMVELRTPQPPLLCTGFAGSVRLGIAKDLFEWGEEGSGCLAGAPILNDFDESTKTPGLFLVGPAVRHDEHIFCFVYKFRQRFAVVANHIAQGLDFETDDVVDECRQINMFLDDFTCCKGACGETC